MINEQLTPKEWQMLSAYLDGQLGQRERRALEARLKSNGDLRQGLEEMRRTRLLLRSAPRRKAPRNFTVSRAMAEAYRPARVPARKAYPAFRLASALASILLVVAFLGDFALSTQEKSAAPAASTMMEAAPPAASLEAGAAQQQDTTATDQGLNAMSQPAGPLPNDTPAPAEPMLAAPLPTLNPTEEIIQRMTNAPPGMGGGAPEATPSDGARSLATGPALTATPEALLQATGPTMKSSAETPAYAAPMAAPTTATPTMPTPAPMERSGYPAVEGADAARQALNFRSILRPAEIVLAIIALFTGIGAFMLRRR